MPHPPSSIETLIPVAGTRMHCMEAGTGDVVLLIHGSLCDHRYWRWQMEAFSSHFRVIAPSLPGCWPQAVAGDMPEGADGEAMRAAALADDRYGMARHVQAVLDLCTQVAPDVSIHLVGHSRGAQVALEAALAMPQRINRLVLADPGFPFTDEPPAHPVHVEIARKLGHAPLDEVIGEFVDAVNGAGTWRRTVSWFKDIVHANAWTLLPQLKDIDRGIDRRAVADTIAGPVLLVGGEQSPPRYGDRLEGLQRILPQARRIVVPRAAHGMNLANARYFNDAVMQFLLEA